VPALSSSLINPALERVADLLAGDRELLTATHLSLWSTWRGCLTAHATCVRHALSSVLAAAIAAVMAWAQSFTAIGEWIADAPPPVLASLAIRRDPLTRRFEPPDEATIRRVLEAVDAAVLDKEIGAWLSARVQAARPESEPHGQRAALAVDGKALRGTRHASADGQAVHLMAVLDQQAPRRWKMADRHRLRHHQPGRPSGHPSSARRLDTRSLADSCPHRPCREIVGPAHLGISRCLVPSHQVFSGHLYHQRLSGREEPRLCVVSRRTLVANPGDGNTSLSANDGCAASAQADAVTQASDQQVRLDWQAATRRQ
jgi:DDE_Tnp_1-associated